MSGFHVRHGRPTQGRKYPQRACSRCGLMYAANKMQAHHDQCSGDATIETAKRTGPRKKGRFIWAQWDSTTLHAIVEQQIHSSEAAFCDHAPEGPQRHWDPAELYMLGRDPRIPGRMLRKCPECTDLTQHINDVTLRLRRYIDDVDAEEIDNES